MTLSTGVALSALALGVGWLLNAATVPSPISAVTPVSVAGFPGNKPTPILVDATWLHIRMGRLDGLVVLDLSDVRRYEEEHIPGAVHGWWQDSMSVNVGVYGYRLQQQAGREGRTALFQSWGIGPDSTVVIYDDETNRYASRVVWLLHYYGFERAMVLDGGLAAWKGAGYDVSDRPADAPDVAPLKTREHDAWVITTTELHERLDDPSLVIIDIRSESEVVDNLNGTIREGMIPGAIRFPWNETVLDESGRLRPPDEMASRLRVAGVTPDQEIVIYSRFGVETGQIWLVLSLLGFERVRVYDRGWATWAADQQWPIEPLPVEPNGSLGAPVAVVSTRELASESASIVSTAIVNRFIYRSLEDSQRFVAGDVIRLGRLECPFNQRPWAELRPGCWVRFSRVRWSSGPRHLFTVTGATRA